MHGAELVTTFPGPRQPPTAEPGGSPTPIDRQRVGRIAAVAGRALAWEREHPEAVGWTYVDVRAMPGFLVGLVVAGHVSVVGEDATGRKLYRLAT